MGSNGNRRTFEFAGMTPELAYLVGVYLGDGTTYIRKGTNYGYFAVKVADMDFLEEAVQCVEAVTGFRPKIHLVREGTGKTRSQYCMRYCSSQFALWLIEITEGKEYIPLEIYDADRRCRMRFIEGLMDSEGSTKITTYEVKSQRAGAQGGTVTLYFSVKAPWINGFKYMLDCLGIITREPMMSAGQLRFSINALSYAQTGLRFSIKRKQDALEYAQKLARARYRPGIYNFLSPGKSSYGTFPLAQNRPLSQS
jgi:hypothetical protein